MIRRPPNTVTVGLYLDQHRDSLMVDDKHLRLLRKHRPQQPLYLERTKRESGRLVATGA